MIDDLEPLLTRWVTGVFATMLRFDVHPQSSPSSLPSGQPHIASSVGFCGQITGIVYLHCSAAFGRKAASVMLGMDESKAGDETVNDVMGEITNMIVGNLKSVFCDRGLRCSLTLPSIVRGADFSVQRVSHCKSVIYYFECQNQPLLVETVLKI
jgi:chemotaxis protein CheX